MVFFFNMAYSKEENKKIRIKKEASMDKTAHLKQLSAQIDAALSRKEEQIVMEKSQNPNR